MAEILEIKAALAAEMAADVHAAMSKYADNKDPGMSGGDRQKTERKGTERGRKELKTTQQWQSRQKKN